MDDHFVIIPSNLPLSIEKMDPQGKRNILNLLINFFLKKGIFLLDNYETIYVYILKDANPQIIKGVKPKWN